MIKEENDGKKPKKPKSRKTSNEDLLNDSKKTAENKTRGADKAPKYQTKQLERHGMNIDKIDEMPAVEDQGSNFSKSIKDGKSEAN
jgi:hypothetical protein